MIRVLFLTPHRVTMDNGGERLTYANLKAVSEYPGTCIDLCSPGYDGALDVFSYGRFGILMGRRYTLRDKWATFRAGASSSLAGVFREHWAAVSGICYDLIFVDSTKIGFFADALPGEIPVLCAVHNVEYDYARRNWRGLSRLAAFNVRRSEQKSVHRSDRLLLLHEKDRDRLAELYGRAEVEEKYILHPACGFAPARPIRPVAERPRRMLFSGSLCTHFNEDSICAFLERSWPQLSHLGYELVVAGRRPGPRLKAAVAAAPFVRLVADPPNMEEYMAQARLLVMPDLYGAGMKLRAAEAMSHGVPIVGTAAALRGYEGVETMGRVVADLEGMAGAVQEVLANESRLQAMADAAVAVWRARYSYEPFRDRVHGAMREVLGSSSGGGLSKRERSP